VKSLENGLESEVAPVGESLLHCSATIRERMNGIILEHRKIGPVKSENEMATVVVEL